MSDERWFFDTNVLVYLFDRKAPDKRQLAQALWERAIDEATPVISTQVLQEFFVTVTKAAKQGLPIAQARRAMQKFEAIAEVRMISLPLVYSATERLEQTGYSFWDSLIIETALEADSTRLWTEDLQPGQTIGKLKIENPFQ